MNVTKNKLNLKHTYILININFRNIFNKEIVVNIKLDDVNKWIEKKNRNKSEKYFLLLNLTLI